MIKTIEQPTGMDPAVKAELQEACGRLASGTPPSSEQKQQALASLKEMQNEVRKRIGVQNIAVDLVRQSRDRR